MLNNNPKQTKEVSGNETNDEQVETEQLNVTDELSEKSTDETTSNELEHTNNEEADDYDEELTDVSMPTTDDDRLEDPEPTEQNSTNDASHEAEMSDSSIESEEPSTIDHMAADTDDESMDESDETDTPSTNELDSIESADNSNSGSVPPGQNTLNVMALLNNLPIGMKYLAVFGFSVILFIGETIMVFIQLSSAKDDVQSIIENNEIASSMTELALLVEQQDSAIAAFTLVGNPRYVEDYEKMEERINEIFNLLEPVFSDGDEELTYGAIKMNSENISNLFLNQLVPQRENDEDFIGTQLEIDTHKNVMINLVSSLINNFSEEQDESIAKVTVSMDQSITFLVVINVISIIAGLITLLIISGFISRNLKRVVNATVTIADGDLTLKPLSYQGRDEIGLLSESVNTLNSNIKNIISKVNDAAKAVTSSSEVLKLSSREVKEGSEQ